MVSFKSALKYALKQEETARDNYLLWSTQTEDKNAKQLFKNLSNMEEKHVKAISNIITQGSTNLALKGFELLDMSYGHQPHSKSNIEYLVRVIKYAISLEEYSMKNYIYIASKVDETSVKKLFMTLAQEEKYHKTLLTQQYNRFLKAH
ncbi:MAG: ferritin family protein [Candidatus Altiarchaeota archaeon]|nr:ferritin family protein [Candidatus Altiarchaeota archaeon]